MLMFGLGTGAIPRWATHLRFDCTSHLGSNLSSLLNKGTLYKSFSEKALVNGYWNIYSRNWKVANRDEVLKLRSGFT